MAKMALSSLKGNLTDIARSYLWDVIFSSPVGGSSTDYELRCQSSNMPGRSVGSILIPFKQTAGVKMPGKNTYSHTWTCTFVEGNDRNVFRGLNDWFQSIVHNKNGLGGTDVKTTVKLRLLSTDGTIKDTIKLHGVYVENLSDVPVSYGSEEAIMVTVTFSFDWWE